MKPLRLFSVQAACAKKTQVVKKKHTTTAEFNYFRFFLPLITLPDRGYLVVFVYSISSCPEIAWGAPELAHWHALCPLFTLQATLDCTFFNFFYYFMESTIYS